MFSEVRMQNALSELRARKRTGASLEDPGPLVGYYSCPSRSRTFLGAENSEVSPVTSLVAVAISLRHARIRGRPQYVPGWVDMYLRA